MGGGPRALHVGLRLIDLFAARSGPLPAQRLFGGTKPGEGFVTLADRVLVGSLGGRADRAELGEPPYVSLSIPNRRPTLLDVRFRLRDVLGPITSAQQVQLRALGGDARVRFVEFGLEGSRVEAGQQLSNTDSVAFVHQHFSNATFDTERDVDFPDIYIAVENERLLALPGQKIPGA